MKKSPILVITVMAAIAATTGLLTALSMSETALAARSGFGGGAGTGGGSEGEPSGFTGGVGGGSQVDGKGFGQGFGLGDFHCGGGGGGHGVAHGGTSCS